MIKFKACPKCRGDIYVAQDIFGTYLNCLQCGYLKDLPAAPVVRPYAVGMPAARDAEAEERVAA